MDIERAIQAGLGAEGEVESPGDANAVVEAGPPGSTLDMAAPTYTGEEIVWKRYKELNLSSILS